MNDFERIGQSIGKLVAEKNRAYGDSFARSGEFLRLLYPDGIPPSKYLDALALVRIFDKMKRIASANGVDPMGEDPYRDIAGYGILGVAMRERVSRERHDSGKLLEKLRDEEEQRKLESATTGGEEAGETPITTEGEAQARQRGGVQ